MKPNPIEEVLRLLEDLDLRCAWRLDPATQEPIGAVVHRGDEVSSRAFEVIADGARVQLSSIGKAGVWYDVPEAAEVLREYLAD